MHVEAKKMAYAGLLLALTVICMALGSVIETSTLFLLAAASYFVGIVIREAGAKFGAAFYIAAVILGLLTAPNKFYVLSFAAMGLYIVIFEISFTALEKLKASRHIRGLFWAVKYLAFNLMFLPILAGFQRILFGRALSRPLFWGAAAAGQLGLYVFDRAYVYFQREIWGKVRGKFISPTID